ncbi:MAG: alpha-hydroxy acid oxidase [Gaiellales bacterium]
MPPLVNVEDARREARRRLPRLAFDFIDGGADDEVTVRENVQAFQRARLRPRHLVNVQERHQGVEIFGTRVDSPVLLAPTGFARLAGGGGDLAGVRAAARRNTIFTLSTMSTHTIEEVARAADGPIWFQLYLVRDPEVNESLVGRARAAGYSALVVTLDVPITGLRERDIRNGLTIPPRLRPRSALDILRRPRWLRSQFPLYGFANFHETSLVHPGRAVAHAQAVRRTIAHAGATIDDLHRLRERWDGPLLVKGTLTREDAERAVDAGVDGIVVSNHGGRQLDTCVTSFEALPEIVEVVDGRIEVFLDSGVRRGTDVVKAIAAGATACFIGRPWLWGAACGGETGVARILEIFHDEIDRALALVGRPNLADLDRAVLMTEKRGPWTTKGPGRDSPVR